MNCALAPTFKTPLVTVILTVFKPRPYLEAAIESVLGQSFSEYELIITDDANSESTRSACRRYRADRTVRYRSNRRRLGALLNIGAALQEARGELIVILNDDDQLEPDMLELLVAPLLGRRDCVLAFGDHSMIDSSGATLAGLFSGTSKLARRLKLTEGMLAEPFSFALRGGTLIGMGAMFRRSALCPEWFRPEVGGAYDLWLGMQLSTTGGVYYMPRTLMRYRIHAGSESARLDPEKVQGGLFILETFLNQQLPACDHAYVQSQLAGGLFVLGRERLYSNNAQGARSAFIRSLRVKPGLKVLVGIGSTYLPRETLRLGLQFWRNIRGIPSENLSAVRSPE
jgi:glycosyltransferase involved in cell wall biosynthesis